MKSNIIYGLGIAALIAYGLYSLIKYDGLEREQGFFLVPFGLAIALLFYISTRERKGK